LIEERKEKITELERVVEEHRWLQQERLAKDIAQAEAKLKEIQIKDDAELARTMAAQYSREEGLKARRAEYERENEQQERRQEEFFQEQKRVEKDRDLRRRRCNKILSDILHSTRSSLPRATEVNLAQGFWHLGVPICDVCQHRCSVQLSYCE
jgi:hypothetical protein